MILTSYEGSNDDYENGGINAHRAQSFQLPSNSNVQSISIFGSAGNGAGGTVRVGIFTGVSPASSGVEVVGKTINTSTLTAFGTPAWNEIIFDTAVDLLSGVEYFLKVMAITGSGADEVRWSTDTTAPAYASGGAWYATTGDTGWADFSASRDKNFRINGTVSGGGGGSSGSVAKALNIKSLGKLR